MLLVLVVIVTGIAVAAIVFAQRSEPWSVRTKTV